MDPTQSTDEAGSTAGQGKPTAARRRRLLIAGAAFFGAMALWQNAPNVWERLMPQRLSFVPLDGLPGFRQLEGGSLSVGFDPLLGIGSNRPTPLRTDPELLRADLCTALFAQPPAAGVVPIAFFSDFYCPFCRVLAGRLAAIDRRGGVAIRWHEWPLLGPSSELAARAALAAERQGAYAAWQAALYRTGFVATPAFLDNVAGRLELDMARFHADMHSESISTAIADARGLAALFGFPGTPALVVGRTVIMGEIGEGKLAAVIERERGEGLPPVCRAA